MKFKLSVCQTVRPIRNIIIGVRTVLRSYAALFWDILLGISRKEFIFLNIRPAPSVSLTPLRISLYAHNTSYDIRQTFLIKFIVIVHHQIYSLLLIDIIITEHKLLLKS